MPQLYKKVPEDLTYKNVFDYLLHLGTVFETIEIFKFLSIDDNCIASRYV